MFWLVLLIFLIVVGWIIASFRRIGPREMAVKVIWEEPIEGRGSGFCFDLRLPLPGCYLIKIPTTQFKVDVPAVEAYTRTRPPYASEPVLVDATLYLFFPKPGETDEEGNNRLIRLVRARIPTTEEGLVAHFANAIQGVVRTAVARFDWRQAVEDLEAVREKADHLFRAPASVLKQAGFSDANFTLAIQRIELPIRLRELLSQPDEARLGAQAAEYQAERQAKETFGLKIKMLAEAFGKTPAEIQAEIDADEGLKKTLHQTSSDLVERMIALEKNALIDIRVEGAQGWEKTGLELGSAIIQLLRRIDKQLPGRPKKKKKTLQIFGKNYEVEVEEE